MPNADTPPNGKRVPPRPGLTRRLARRGVLAAAVLLAGILVVAGRPVWRLVRTAAADVDLRAAVPDGQVDDASRLNSAPVREVRAAPSDPAEAERAIAALLDEARVNGWRVAIGGARHSMGGHTIYPGGVVLDMRPLAHMDLDESSETLRVGAGARWSEVLAYLDRRGRSVAVMQSNNSFTVGGSISVNCHGWQHGCPPIASTVRSFRLMRADGAVVPCSRTENRELFAGALGGYGLFGVILEAELLVRPNRRYRVERRRVAAEKLEQAIYDITAGPDSPEMFYARLDVTPSRFLDEAVLYAMRPVDDGADLPPIRTPGMAGLRRSVFRGSADDDYGKSLRWRAEVHWSPLLGEGRVTRNQLLNEGVEVFENRTAETTDILHEYFVPPSQSEEFLARLREIAPRHEANLLNVTVRGVEQDDDTLLRYADGPMTSFVLLFVQERTDAGESRMQSLTRELIDAALDLGGRHYLPYRLHATSDQFRRGYPSADRFFELKRLYDPEELFQNEFYARYGRSRHVGAQTD